MYDVVVALGIAAVAAVFLAHRWTTVWSSQFADDAPIPARPPFAQFVAATPNLDDKIKTSEASDLLVDRQSKIYEEINDASKAQDAKATTILGFVGGGASLYALVSGSKPGANPSVTAMLGLCAVFFLGSLLACLLCLVGRRRRGLPEIRSQLSAVPVLDSPDTTKARISAYLLGLLIDRNESYRRVNIRKSYYMELAQQLFAAGVLTLVVNFFLVGPGAPARPSTSTVHCATASAKPVGSTFDCTITGENHGT